jgi:predicted DNA-binding transcriptional regulator AlpA
MKEIMGKKYLTEKEVADRYGYSKATIIKMRSDGNGPKYTQMRPHGRVLYSLENTDGWFNEMMKDKE